MTWSEFQQVSVLPSKRYFFPNCLVSLLRVLLTRQVYWCRPPHSRGAGPRAGQGSEFILARLCWSESGIVFE